MATKKRAAKKTAGKDPETQDLGADGATPEISAKAARKQPMYVASTIHLKGKNKGDDLRVITGGVMLDEIDEELSDDEIDELISLKALRPATTDEIAAAEKRAEEDEE